MPAVEILKSENIFVMDSQQASTQDIRPLRIVILNLMPLKITTETDLIRLLSNTPLQIEVDFLKISGHISKNTPVEHMMTFYKDFSTLRNENYDGMIITGAPVENMEFEEINYWDELTKIMEWSKTHVTSTLHICWGMQAGLYYHDGIHKHDLQEKLFGAFPHMVARRSSMFMRGFDDMFMVPHSRHTTIRREEV